MMDPKRKPLAAEPVANGTRRGTRSTAGRWSLFTEEEHRQLSVTEAAREQETAMLSHARMLLARYGVVFRDLIAREANAPRWRDLLGILRRLEARGEIRGGRFVSGFSGEQYALPEAVESLRMTRDLASEEIIGIAAADPINLIGVVVPGERTAAVAGKRVYFKDGVAVGSEGEPLKVEISSDKAVKRSAFSSAVIDPSFPRASRPERGGVPSRPENPGLFA